MKVPIEGLRSKSWDEFAAPGAPPIDFVFTVCDNAAGETCPIWPGQPMTAHWGIADPAAVGGSPQERRTAFRKAFSELDSRIKIFASLPIRALERTRLQERLDAIGKPDRALTSPEHSLRARLTAEGLGALLLAAAVIGSGIMAERLAGGNQAIALLANTGATVAALATLIAMLGPVSGAHFNPVISLVAVVRGDLPAPQAAAYAAMQVAGCCAAPFWQTPCSSCRWWRLQLECARVPPSGCRK